MTKERVRRLSKEWTATRGQCKGFKYALILSGRRGNLYEVDTGDTRYYEVVIPSKNKANPKYKSHRGFDYVEVYPGIDNWGEQGWTIMEWEKAVRKFIEVNKKEKGSWEKQ